MEIIFLVNEQVFFHCIVVSSLVTNQQLGGYFRATTTDGGTMPMLFGHYRADREGSDKPSK